MSNEQLAVPALVERLEQATARMTTEVQKARAEVQAQRRAVGEMVDRQKQLGVQAAEMKARLAQLAEGQAELRRELTRRIEAVEREVQEVTRTLSTQQSQLQELVAASREERALSELERQRGLALVGIRGTLGGLRDGAVRRLFAERVLVLLAEQGVGASSFRALSDQAEAQAVMEALRAARDGGDVNDREEARRFDELTRFVRDVADVVTSYSRQRQQNEGLQVSLRTSEVGLARTIEMLERPETPAATRRRGAVRGWLLIVGIVAALGGVGAVVVEALDSSAFAEGVLGVIGIGVGGAGIGLIALSWLFTDAYRAWRLRSAKARLEGVRASESVAVERARALERDLEASASRAQAQLATLGGRCPTSASDPPIRRLSTCLDEGRGLLRTWRVRHPEASGVLGPLP